MANKTRTTNQVKTQSKGQSVSGPGKISQYEDLEPVVATKKVAKKVPASPASVAEQVKKVAAKKTVVTPATKTKVTLADPFKGHGKLVKVVPSNSKKPLKERLEEISPAVKVKKTSAEVSKEFLDAKASGKKRQVQQTDELPEKSKTSKKREEQEKPKPKGPSQVQLKQKYHTESASKSLGREPAAKDFNWKTIPEVGGVKVARNTCFKARDPLSNWKDYPAEVIFDPMDTGLQLTRVKSYDRLGVDGETFYKADRKKYLKSLTGQKKITAESTKLSEVEIYSVTSERQFIIAISWGSDLKNLTPADQI